MKEIKYAYRMVHIGNIPHIASCGFVHRDSPLASPNYIEIGSREVIKKRNDIYALDTLISECIPFYFGYRTPMLFSIQYGFNVKQVKAEKIVYCVIALDDLIRDNIDCIFSDGHALAKWTDFHPGSMLPQITSFINPKDIYAKYWHDDNDRDLKRRKEAELLIKQELSPDYIKCYIVYNENAKEQLINYGIDEKRVAICPNYYF